MIRMHASRGTGSVASNVRSKSTGSPPEPMNGTSTRVDTVGFQMIVVWRGLDAFRTEYARVQIEGARLFAHGTQLGIEPAPYLLRYRLEPERLAVEIDDGPSLDLELGDHDAFDLGLSPLFNSIPIIRDRLQEGGPARDYRMAWVSVPELAVEESMQHYEPLALGRLRFSAGDFAAELELDRDGIVQRYEGLAERIA